jgi:hypothetical protein
MNTLTSIPDDMLRRYTARERDCLTSDGDPRPVDNRTNQNRCQTKGTEVMLRCRLVAERKGLPCTVTPEEVRRAR